MIAGVSITRDEYDIVGLTVGHLIAEGVERIYIIDESTDGTKEILAGFPEVELIDWDRQYDQSAMMTSLADHAHDRGAEWIIPFDADELWCATEGTVRSQLEACDKNLVHVPLYDQLGDWMAPDQKPMGKAAFRWTQGCWIREGNHGVDGVPGEAAHGLLEVREFQNRSLEQFIRKARRNQALFAANPQLAEGYGTHNRVWARMTDEELGVEWERIKATPRVFSPPRSSFRSTTVST